MARSHFIRLAKLYAPLALVVLSLGVGCTRELTVNIDGAGEIMGADKATLCKSGACVLEIEKDTEVVLVAKPAQGGRFEGWKGACSGQDKCTIVLDDNHRVTAKFVRTAYLNVELDGDGTGVIESGLDCPKGCSLELQEGVKAELEPKPDQGMEFAGWHGACAGLGICSVNVTGEVKVTATFSIPLGTRLAHGKLEVANGREVVGVVGAGGEVVVAATGGDGPTFIRADGEGNRLWAKLPPKDVFTKVNAVAPMPDEGFVAGGVAKKSDCALALYRKDGEITWKVALPDCGAIVDVAVTGTPGNETIVALGTVGAFGSSYDFLGTSLKMKGNADAFIARFDLTGELSSVVTAGTRKADEPLALALSADGSAAYVAMCGPKACRVAAVAADGSERWERKYPRGAFVVHDIEATERHVYVVGEGDSKKAAERASLHKDAAGKTSCAGTAGVLLRLNANTGAVEQAASYGASLRGVRARDDVVVVAGTFGPDEMFGGKRLIAGGTFSEELDIDCEAQCKADKDEPAKREACMEKCKADGKPLEERCALTGVEAFAAGLDTDGKVRWASLLDDVHPTTLESIELDDEGRVYVAARKAGTPSPSDDKPASMAYWVRLK